MTLGSVFLNGSLQNVNSLVAFSLGTVPAGATFTLSFQVTVINIPVQNPIINNAFASYLYTVNPALPATSKQQTLILLQQQLEMQTFPL